MISFFCPFCKHVLKAADELAGQQMACEQCKLEILVPQPAAPPPLSQPPLSQPAAQSVSPPWWKRLLKRGQAHLGV